MLKILQARLQQYVNWELSDVQAGFRKGWGTPDQITNIRGSQRKQENSRKTSTSASLTMLKLLTIWITTNWKILKEMGILDHLTCFLKNWYMVKKQQLEPDVKQWICSKLGKKYIKAVYCLPVYLTYMQSTSCEMPGWITNWNQDCWEKYQQPQICIWHHPYGRKRRTT